MDFEDTPSERSFREAARNWLRTEALSREKPGETFQDRFADEPSLLVAARSWQLKKARAGYAAISLPKEHGGAGGSVIQQIIYLQEESKYLVPSTFAIGIGMCAPTLAAYATESQRATLIPRILSGEDIWCQLFSEPGAGSDLAGLSTRAVRNGDSWVVNGQKVWTSGAHYAQWGLLIARTNSSMPKHKGITAFMLDMTSPGIETKPIKQLSGGANFNEVFLDNVRIPDSHRLGDVDDGWRVSITTLSNERMAVGDTPGADFEAVFELAQQTRMSDGRLAIENEAVREKLARWYYSKQGVKFTQYRMMTALSRGQTPGPEASITKIVNANRLQEIAIFGLDLLGARGIVKETGRSTFQDAYLTTPRSRVAGGTDEILRNIIGERVLGLPPDIRLDKDVPFNEIPKSGF